MAERRASGPEVVDALLEGIVARSDAHVPVEVGRAALAVVHARRQVLSIDLDEPLFAKAHDERVRRYADALAAEAIAHDALDRLLVMGRGHV